MAEKIKRNAYSVLGLHKGCSEDLIKKAYVSLVKKYDPEVHTERFMIIQDAFNRLKESERRAREDILTFNHIQIEPSYGDEERAEVPPEKLNQAIQTLEQKLKAEPALAHQITQKLITAYFMRSWRNLQKNLWKEAMDDWMRILELDPTHQRAKKNLLFAYCRLGYSYATHNLYDEAIDIWEKAAQMNPDNDKIVHNLALACEFGNRNDESLRYWSETLRRWSQMLERNPFDEYLKNCQVEGLRHQSEIGKGESIEVLAPAETNNRAINQHPPKPGRPTASSQPSSHQPPPKTQPPPPARDELQQHREILKLRPDDFEASLRVATLLMEQKKWPEASAHLAELVKRFPKNLDGLNRLGWAQLNNQEVDQAFQTWNRALKLEPKNNSVRESVIKARMNLGKALRDKRLFVQSLKNFKELSAMLPDSDEVHFELGNTYKMQGDLRSAYNEFQAVLKINPKHKLARSSLSELKMRRA